MTTEKIVYAHEKRLSDLVTAAQAHGDTCYAEAVAAGLSREDCANAYHVAYVNAMWDFGVSTPCACDYCQGA